MKPIDIFFFNFAKISILSNAGMTFSESVALFDKTGDESLDSFFMQFAQAFGTNDFAPVELYLSKLQETIPDMAIAKMHVSIFLMIDNGAFQRFGNAAVLYKIIKQVRETGAVTEAMRRFLNNELSMLTPEHKLRVYVRSINSDLDPDVSQDYIEVSNTEIFPGVQEAVYPLSPEFEQILKQMAETTGVVDLVTNTKEQLSWYNGLLL